MSKFYDFTNRDLDDPLAVDPTLTIVVPAFSVRLMESLAMGFENLALDAQTLDITVWRGPTAARLVDSGFDGFLGIEPGAANLRYRILTIEGEEFMEIRGQASGAGLDVQRWMTGRRWR